MMKSTISRTLLHGICVFLMMMMASSLTSFIKAQHAEQMRDPTTGLLIPPPMTPGIMRDHQQDAFYRNAAAAGYSNITYNPKNPWHRANHECIHDTHIVPQQEREMEQLRRAFPQGIDFQNFTYDKNGNRDGAVVALQGIRIKVSTPDLYDSSKYCTSSSGTSPDMKGGTISCTADTVFTSAKRTLLLNTFLPWAINKFKEILTVTPYSGNLVFPSACGSTCGSHTVESSVRTTGVADADYVLFVSAAPTSGNTIAWCGYCCYFSGQQPRFGRLNFSPEYLVYDANDPYSVDKANGVTLHELAHGLGVTSSLLTGGSYVSTTTRRGKTVTQMTSSIVVQKAREFYGCSSLTGMEREDQGGSGTTGSHLERRLARDSVMAGITGLNRIDPVFLAVMDSAPWYTADFSKAEDAVWGNNKYHGKGCGFVNNLAGTAAAGNGDWCDGSEARRPCPFCGPGNNSMCSQDWFGIGKCLYNTYSGSISPSYFQNFAGQPTIGGSSSDLIDYASYVQVWSNRICNNPAEEDKDSSNNQIFGYTYKTAARCVQTTGLVKNGYIYSTSDARCIEIRCPSGNRVEMRIRDDVWMQCPTNGLHGNIQASGQYKGTIYCPAARDICTDDLYYAEATPAPPTPAPTTSSTTTSSTTTSSTTTTTPTTTTTSSTTTPTTTSTTSSTTSTTRTSTTSTTSTTATSTSTSTTTTDPTTTTTTSSSTTSTTKPTTTTTSTSTTTTDPTTTTTSTTTTDPTTTTTTTTDPTTTTTSSSTTEPTTTTTTTSTTTVAPTTLSSTTTTQAPTTVSSTTTTTATSTTTEAPTSATTQAPTTTTAAPTTLSSTTTTQAPTTGSTSMTTTSTSTTTEAPTTTTTQAPTTVSSTATTTVAPTTSSTVMAPTTTTTQAQGSTSTSQTTSSSQVPPTPTTTTTTTIPSTVASTSSSLPLPSISTSSTSSSSSSTLSPSTTSSPTQSSTSTGTSSLSSTPAPPTTTTTTTVVSPYSSSSSSESPSTTTTSETSSPSSSSSEAPSTSSSNSSSSTPPSPSTFTSTTTTTTTSTSTTEQPPSPTTTSLSSTTTTTTRLPIIKRILRRFTVVLRFALLRQNIVNTTIARAFRRDTANALRVVFDAVTVSFQNSTDTADQLSATISVEIDESQSVAVESSFTSSIEQNAQPLDWLPETLALLQEQGMTDSESNSVQLVSAAAESNPTTSSTAPVSPSTNEFCEGDQKVTCIIVGCSVGGGFLLLIIGVVLYRGKKKKTINLSTFLNATETSNNSSTNLSHLNSTSRHPIAPNPHQGSPYQINRQLRDQHQGEYSQHQQQQNQVFQMAPDKNDDLDEYIRGLEENYELEMQQNQQQQPNGETGNTTNDAPLSQREIDDYFSEHPVSNQQRADDYGRQVQHYSPLNSNGNNNNTGTGNSRYRSTTFLDI